MKTLTIKSKHGYDIPCNSVWNGEKKVLIVCHGFGSSKASPMVQALEEYMPKRGIGVFAFDFPAHGESPCAAPGPPAPGCSPLSGWACQARPHWAGDGAPWEPFTSPGVCIPAPRGSQQAKLGGAPPAPHL